MAPHNAAFAKIVSTDTSAASIVAGGATGSASTGTGGFYGGSAVLNSAAAPLVTPLSLRGGGAIGVYTLVNSGVVYLNAAGTEQYRIWGTDPNRSNNNSANLYIGYQAGNAQPTANTSGSGSDNIGIGWSALAANTSGDNSIAIGSRALFAATTGGDNIAIGVTALEDCTTGGDNIAIGSSALANVTTADFNVAIGPSALLTVTTGANNVALGNSTLSLCTGDNNTAIGDTALRVAAATSNNTAIGAASLLFLTTGSSNVALGYGSGEEITGATPLTSATQSVLIGMDTRPSANGNTNEIVIGYNADGHGSNTATLGNTSVTHGYLPLSLFQGTRAVAMGDWANQAFSAGEYTSETGSWTVGSGDVTTNRYSQVGKTVTWQLVLANTTVSGTPTQLRVAIPGGLTAAAVARAGGCGATTTNGTPTATGVWTLASGGTYVALRRSQGEAWEDGTDNTSISAVVVFEIA